MKILHINRTDNAALMKCNCGTIFKVKPPRKVVMKCPCKKVTTNLKFLFNNYKRSIDNETVDRK